MTRDPYKPVYEAVLHEVNRQRALRGCSPVNYAALGTAMRHSGAALGCGDR